MFMIDEKKNALQEDLMLKIEGDDQASWTLLDVLMINLDDIDNYLFLPVSDCIIITTKINQLVIIKFLHRFV